MSSKIARLSVLAAVAVGVAGGLGSSGLADTRSLSDVLAPVPAAESGQTVSRERAGG